MALALNDSLFVHFVMRFRVPICDVNQGYGPSYMPRCNSMTRVGSLGQATLMYAPSQIPVALSIERL